MTAFRCIIHGSFSKHFVEIQQAREVFTRAGIEVMAPKAGQLATDSSGFALFEDEQGQDPRLVELLYLHNLKTLGENGFSYLATLAPALRMNSALPSSPIPAASSPTGLPIILRTSPAAPYGRRNSLQTTFWQPGPCLSHRKIRIHTPYTAYGKI